MPSAILRPRDSILASTADTAAPSASRASPFLSALFLVFAGFTILRVGLNPLMLDLVVNYTADQGSIVEKLHPALYGFAGIAVIAFLCLRVTLDAWEVRVVRAMMAFIIGIVTLIMLTTLAGRGGNAGFLIDTYAGACCCALLFLFPPSWRNAVGQVLVCWLVLSGLVGLVEFGLKIRFQPFSETERAFRPIGLAAHPLDLGLWMAVAISFCAATEWSGRAKAGVCTVLVLALGASGARFASMMGLVSAVALALGAVGAGRSSRKRLEWRIVAMTAGVVIVPLVVAALYAAGALSRFESGLDDSNARARVAIYDVFDYLSWQDILVGTDIARVRKIALIYLKLEYIESSLVIFVIQFGVLGTMAFAGLFGWLLRILLIGAKPAVLLGTLVFFTVILSSNGLTSKGSAIFLLMTLIIAFRPAQPKTRRVVDP
ncbi:VpsF family polysaccharide biosynthesis protein [uncultured Methylobacterium sp.]|uniref:VpsF family polysaccharide biosynthesis protein n=1 Tax=uncultured Methylobacterium sp. TaxID=157278 RepID=UPI0035C9994C